MQSFSNQNHTLLIFAQRKAISVGAGVFCFLSLILGSCKKEHVLAPPEIIITHSPETIPVLSPVHFTFDAKAEAGLAVIEIRHVLQNAVISKGTDFKTATFDHVEFSHSTGFESINQHLQYAITVRDKQNRSASKTIAIKVANSAVDVAVSDGQQAVTSLPVNKKTTVHVAATSTSSLFLLSVTRLSKNSEPEFVYFKNNIQLQSPDLLKREFGTTLELAPDSNTTAFRFDVEDNAGVKKSLVIPVQ
ncbi:hypothetical protein [Paracnuella aquatica]|uniref:hypothetical protein n=1 Tax=Paracnuella aquatica TaxID=2268757 RepID=UPI000F4FF473|nr:hypothetical protein [Paracnuella aquatica]RPD43698.1 hypothetical protein DRJ53_19150 [Paracnuella aquatica]